MDRPSSVVENSWKLCPRERFARDLLVEVAAYFLQFARPALARVWVDDADLDPHVSLSHPEGLREVGVVADDHSGVATLSASVCEQVK